MSKVWEIFENLSEIVYVSDIDSHELIYMNKRTMQEYGFNSYEDYAGKKCYEVLQGCSSPCAICTNGELSEGQFKEWQYFNPNIGKTFSLKDTLIIDNGRRCRMEIAIDMSAQVRQSRFINEYTNLESVINEGMRLALQEPTPERTIQVILEYFGKSLNSERVYIFEENERGTFDNTYEWVASGVTPEKDNLQDIPYDVVKMWYQKFKENKDIIIEDLEDIREEDPLMYEVLKPQNIHSLVVNPLFYDKKTIGFYGVDNPPSEFLAMISDMFQIMGHFFVSTLRRRNLLKRLEAMSYSDQLTDIGNRHAMNDYLVKINHEDSLGIVYCDVTGLKRVNDRDGHEAGDKLLLRACSCLKRFFEDYALFRIGGDEFLAICPKISEEELRGRVERLRTDMRENDAIMAIGVVWRQDGRENINMLLSEADGLMYDDKRAYYAAAGIERRRR